MNFLSSALPWQGLFFFPALLVFIAVLLFSTAALAFYVRHTLSFTRLRQVLERFSGVRGNVLAALLGAATPFCTCTALPLFLSMLEADVAPGPAVSFLLASPTINLGALVLLLIVFGWHLTLFYTCICLLAAVIVGRIMGSIPRERALRDYLWFQLADPVPAGRRVALTKAALQSKQLTLRFLPWLILATLGGMLIDIVIPTSSIVHLSQWTLWLGIPGAAVLGSVIYADILLLIPLGFALIEHHVPASIVLTFLLAASGLSLPEIVVLGRIFRMRLVALFVGATLLVYMLLGYSFLWL